MADGTTKPIESIEIGEDVLSFDAKTNTFKADKVTETFKHISEGYLIVNGHLKVTPNHPVYSNGRWVEIGSLKIGDKLTNAQGKEEIIQSMVRITEEIKTYNIEVNPYHTYIAGGVVVHNKDEFIMEPCFPPECDP
jgi:intein/homing endonuclease